MQRDARLMGVVDRLVADFGPERTAHDVIRTVVRCRNELLGSVTGNSAEGWAESVERLARLRLEQTRLEARVGAP